MISAIFPSLAGLEYPVVRTPIFRTLVQQSVSGQENRAALQLYPRWQWTLSFNFLRDDANDEFRTLLAFFMARKGSFDPFLFEDTDDNSVTAQPIGHGNGSNAVFQLIRGFGGFDEPVLTPNTVTMKINGVATSAWHFSGPGEVTFTGAPANGAAVSADMTYYWPVRFLADQYDFAKFMNRLWEQKNLDFISLKNV